MLANIYKYFGKSNNKNQTPSLNDRNIDDINYLLLAKKLIYRPKNQLNIPIHSYILMTVLDLLAICTDMYSVEASLQKQG